MLLDCEGVTASLPARGGMLRILDDVRFRLARRSTLGIVGESGAGKSMLIKAIMGLAPSAIRVEGRIALDGTELVGMPEAAKRALLGRKVGMVFQNPMTSLNPFVRVGRQIEEGSRRHLGLGRAEARARAIDLLAQVGIPDPAECHGEFPHRFSGGMKQRIMIATALACRPDLLIADEATTALDVTVQKDILDLLQAIQRERRMSMILVTHNLAVVANRTDEILVLYGGRVVEHGPTALVFAAPRHRYTEALLSAVPRMDQPAHTRLRTIPGPPPDLHDRAGGCPFAPRCPAAEARCRVAMPPMTLEADGRHGFACFVPVEAPRPALAEATQ
ncbi:ABC transporter ATP-binding protein [Prosthecomicrobium sp. N25]|uniref:ABC transporter ATP-binding protein n=1 Tax=Prosthecomicrobium sp. N25 TaxID=3129254 RepID=UPI003076CC7D